MLKTKISQVFGCSDIVTFKDLHRNIQNCFSVKLTRLRTYRVSDEVGSVKPVADENLKCPIFISDKLRSKSYEM